ncbi:MAG: HlyD family efflux transporter periplasmic adaptor subunit [Bacteroidales bacterium]
MDRSLPREIIRKRRIRLMAGIVGTLLAFLIVSIGIRNITFARIHQADIMVSEVEAGEVSITFAASGKVIPAYEEALISPVSTKVTRIMSQPGQRVEKGQKLLEVALDKQKYEYERLQAEFQRMRNNHQRLSIDIRKKEAAARLAHELLQRRITSLEEECENEKYLLSIGGSARDKVAKLDMELSAARLELEHSGQELEYNREMTRLELQSLDIDLQIHKNKVAEMENLLEQGKLQAPIAGTLSFLLEQAGTSISQGEVVARVADLSAYRVEAVLGDGYASQLSAGQQVLVRVADEDLAGEISHIAPSVTDGVLNFGILLHDPSHQRLRPNMKVEIKVIAQQIDNTLRIKTGGYYKGPGLYELFVVDQDVAHRRQVRLGGASFSHVQVISGLESGQQVVVSPMDEYLQFEKIKIRN